MIDPKVPQEPLTMSDAAFTIEHGPWLWSISLVAMVVFLLACCGCAPAPEVPVREYQLDLTFHGDTRHDANMRFLWEAQMKAFRRFTHGRGRIYVTWDLTDEIETLEKYAKSPRIVLVSPNDARLAAASAHVGRGPACATVVWLPQPVIYMAPERCPAVVPVMLHELGHVLGLDDVNHPGSVMHQQMGHSQMFTAADEWECHRVGLCTE